MPVVLAIPFSGQPQVGLAVDLSTADRTARPEVEFDPRPVNALMDTGASRSLIAIDILEGCGLTQAGEVQVNTASSGNEPEILLLFSVNLWIAGEQRGLLAEDLGVAGSDKLGSLRIDMLLGRDVLHQCLLVYDGAGRTLSLAYDPPTGSTPR